MMLKFGEIAMICLLIEFGGLNIKYFSLSIIEP